MKPTSWRLEDGEPVFDASLTLLSSSDADRGASRNDRARIADWAEPHLPPDLTAQQAEQIECCARYGHYFGRQVFRCNSYNKKDVIGRVIACALSDEKGLVLETVIWSNHIFKRRLKHHDVRKLIGFEEIYDWAFYLTLDLNAAGWPLTIESMTDVRP